MNTSKNKLLEWSGVITAIIYSILVALNIGAEFVGFSLLLTSAILIGLWAYYGKHGGIMEGYCYYNYFMHQLASLVWSDGFD